MNKRFLLMLVGASCLSGSSGKAQTVQKQKIGNFIESTSYNEHKRGVSRTLQYYPDGEDFVCVNGKNRYTRALYGGSSPFRLETSDKPVFAAYDKSYSQNISFRLSVPRQGIVFLDSVDYCEARYTAGRRSYRLTDPAWGKGELRMTVLALHSVDGAIWKIESKDMPKGSLLIGSMVKIKAERLNRNGDMGADPADSFEAPENPQYTCSCGLNVDDNRTAGYLLLKDLWLNILSPKEGEKLFAEAEEARNALASRIRFDTPDPFINTIGGALAVAADGIWDGEVWLHGAIGWRMPLSGWRAAYTGDALGWHDRARTHFDAYAASQVTNVPNTIPHPAQDTLMNLARSEKRWGTPQYSNGYICRNPLNPNQMHHYDMNLCYIDELLWHFNWTGDLEYARQMWPVIVRHLAWEKLNYDPDNDGLYDAYACIWASDALYYNSGAVTHSSAYNYRANKMAARIAEKIGENPEPYRAEAAKILTAINSRLWLPDKGHWAEYQDFMGHKRLHESAGVWTIYHAIDGNIADPFQAFQATRYMDTEIPHIPVQAMGLPDEGYETISTTNWLPYSWSVNNVAFAEVMHTSLAYFLAGRREEGFKLLKSSVLDGMYLGDSPGNFGQVSFYDAARGECYRDFGDPIGVASRLFIQGLFGIYPDALNDRLLIRPGFPASWPHAALQTPDITFSYKQQERITTHGAAFEDVYCITQRFVHPLLLDLQIPARMDNIVSVTVNGYPATWKRADTVVGYPLVSITVPATANDGGNSCEIKIEWGGAPIVIPSVTGNRSTFTETTQGEMTWWNPVHQWVETETKEVAPSFVDVVTAQCEPVMMDDMLNASVTDIYANEYESPRSPYTTLQLPLQGIGEWCHPKLTADIDDSGLRAQVHDAVFHSGIGVPFRTPAMGKNIAFTSLWDNYPDSIAVSLSGKATHAYLLMAGSTNHMQCHIANGQVRIHYADGSTELLELTNPDTWCPIEQDYFVDDVAFKLGAIRPYRLHLKSGLVSNNLERDLNITGVYGRAIDGGAGLLVDIKLDPRKELKKLTLETLSNDVVIGLMGVTLQR